MRAIDSRVDNLFCSKHITIYINHIICRIPNTDIRQLRSFICGTITSSPYKDSQSECVHTMWMGDAVVLGGVCVCVHCER